MKANLKLSTLMLLFATLFIFSACKKNFDEPPISELPNLHGNISIADVKALATATPFKMDSSKVIEAVVIANDKSGNFYKQIVLQDSTGGIRIDINAYNLYNDYAVGRKVWVRLAGLYAWKDGDVVALVGSSDVNNSRIPQALYKTYIIGGELNHFVTPKLRTLSTLTAADYNTLVKLEGMEFTANYAGQTFANVITQQSVNAEVHECATSSTIIMRNSGYAKFAAQLAPTGNGSVTAVFNSFNGTSQLFIRDPQDLDMPDARCTFLPGLNAIPMTIDSVRKLYTGTTVYGPLNRKIRGIVISDLSTGNFQPKNLILQEVNGDGIVVRFSSNHAFNMGDVVEVDISNQEISEFKGLLQITNVPNSYASQKGTGQSITPRVATTADITTNAEEWESTLVKVMSATLSNNSVYSGNVTLTDPSGTLNLYTSSFATFANDLIPTNTGDVTAIIGQYNSLQLNIRNTADVNIAGGGGTATVVEMPIDSLRMLFTGSSTNAPANKKITGIVISDYANQNISSKNMVFQNSQGAGIVIRFTGNHTFAVGDSLEIDISGQQLSEYNGILQLNNVANAKATMISGGHTVTPRTATISDINTHFEEWESTLVTITGATITGGTTYGGTLSVTDGTATIDLYTRSGASGATFANTAVPTTTVSVTAILSQFNTTNQLSLRNSTDVQ